MDVLRHPFGHASRVRVVRLRSEPPPSSPPTTRPTVSDDGRMVRSVGGMQIATTITGLWDFGVPDAISVPADAIPVPEED